MRRALGRGLSQLLAEPPAEAAAEVSVDAIDANPRQPRTQFEDEALDELAGSIREHGVLQPVAVRPKADGRYELIAGERRLRAAKRAGLKTIPVVVREAGNQDSLELALIENIQREDINAMECARAFRRLIDEFGLTQEQVAAKVGKSRVAVANTVRLVRLPKRIQDAIESRAISEGHGRAILALESEAEQLAVLDRILQEELSVKDVERLGKARAPRPKAGRREPPREPHWQTLEEALSNTFGSPVRLRREGVGGTLAIEFYSDDDLQRILELLGVQL